MIDTRTDTHIWAEEYDRDLNDLFAIQAEIAQKVAERLRAKITAAEKLAIEQPPTIDLAAFDLSAGQSHCSSLGFSGRTEPDLRKAIELLDEAVKRDPSFFDAYCELAYAHEYFYGVSGYDHTPARLALAEAAVQAATRLRPDAAETHLARAQYLYFGLRDYAGALAELEIARRALPNDPRLLELTGYILRRRGQQEEGLQNLQRAAELDPRNIYTLQQIALSYQGLGAMPSQSLRWIGCQRSCPTTSKRGPIVDYFISSGKRTHGRSARQLMQFSPEGRAPSPAARTSGSIARWPNAIRLRPNEHSRWATIHAGVNPGLS